MQYTLTRSRRKTAAIYIRNGEVEVRAPLKMLKQEIDQFVLSKAQWISKHLAKQQVQSKQREAFTINYNSDIMYRGTKYTIVKRDGTTAGFDGDVLYMPPDISPERIKAVCIQIYKRLAQSYISERVIFYAARMGVTPSSVKINSARTRWGSCSSKKRLNFTWRLIMAEDGVIDYVVIHELAHLIEMNHSSRFWAVVAKVLPDYTKRKAQLKILQKKLSGEDWSK